MKTADEWADEATDAGDYGVRRRIATVRAIQADAIEAAAQCLERSLMFAEANAPGGLGVPPQEQKWVDAIRRLKDAVGGEK